MGRFHAEIGEIDQTVVTLSQMAEFCQQLLADIDRIRDGVAAEWSGDAAAQFAARHAEWVAGAAEMNAGIATMHAAASTSSSNYTAATASSRSVWG